MVAVDVFQSAPALRGECYSKIQGRSGWETRWFQSAPALRGECYLVAYGIIFVIGRVSIGTRP